VRRTLLFLAVAAVIVTGCGGSDDDDTSSRPADGPAAAELVTLEGHDLWLDHTGRTIYTTDRADYTYADGLSHEGGPYGPSGGQVGWAVVCYGAC